MVFAHPSKEGFFCIFERGKFGRFFGGRYKYE